MAITMFQGRLAINLLWPAKQWFVFRVIGHSECSPVSRADRAHRITTLPCKSPGTDKQIRRLASNWITVTESKFSWERDALEFVRERFPAHEPYRASSNFEFIADDGSINEVDLLVFTPQGFFFVEIKSRPGRLFGDAHTWTWETDGRLSSTDNPVFLANSKAKKLRSLLSRQRAIKHYG